MINFRYHVVSLTAVFLALALGLVVGTAALNGPLSDSLRDQVTAAAEDRLLRDSGEEALGARTLRRAVEREGEEPLARYLLTHGEGGALCLDWDGTAFSLRPEKAPAGAGA